MVNSSKLIGYIYIASPEFTRIQPKLTTSRDPSVLHPYRVNARSRKGISPFRLPARTLPKKVKAPESTLH